MDTKKAEEITEILINSYPHVCALDNSSPYELTVATILSAQCTDVRVNMVTKELFALANTPEKMLALGKERLLNIIRPCGLSPTKAEHIINTSQMIIDKFGGEVPGDFNSLVTLAGVGRKTANVVLANAFGADVMAVDTHVFRVSNRIGLTKAKNPLESELQLTSLIKKGSLSAMHHSLIYHGRALCTARKPMCESCMINTLCEKHL